MPFRDYDARCALQDVLTRKYSLLRPNLDERGRRLWAATEAMSLGHGGIALLQIATGLSRPTIAAGMAELEAEFALEAGRVRRSGGGRKPLEETDPTLVADLESLVDPVSRGDPESVLRWVSMSLRKISRALAELGHAISPPKVADLLRNSGFSLQANRKTREGNQHPDRDAQFGYVNEQARAMQAQGQPVISVDCKKIRSCVLSKKELVGDFKNAGVEWRPQGEPEEVRVHDDESCRFIDFIDKDLGKAIPYGVYDITRNEAWVSVGCDHDTAEFAGATILRFTRV